MGGWLSKSILFSNGSDSIAEFLVKQIQQNIPCPQSQYLQYLKMWHNLRQGIVGSGGPLSLKIFSTIKPLLYK
jgi:hypothetical protein